MAKYNVKRPRPLPTPEELLRRLAVDPQSPSGLRWTARANNNGAPAGSVAGSRKASGYWYIGFGGHQLLAHRLVWRISTGSDPGPMEIDHRDGNPSNNAWVNLRLASHAQNTRNRPANRQGTSKYCGVSWDRVNRKWRATISSGGRLKCLGRFPIEEDAARAYDEAATRAYGDFARLNLP